MATSGAAGPRVPSVCDPSSGFQRERAPGAPGVPRPTAATALRAPPSETRRAFPRTVPRAAGAGIFARGGGSGDDAPRKASTCRRAPAEPASGPGACAEMPTRARFSSAPTSPGTVGPRSSPRRAPAEGAGGRLAAPWRRGRHCLRAPSPAHAETAPRPIGQSHTPPERESVVASVTCPAGVGQGRRRRQQCRRRRVGNGGVLGVHLRHRERQVSENRLPGLGPGRWASAGGRGGRAGAAAGRRAGEGRGGPSGLGSRSPPPRGLSGGRRASARRRGAVSVDWGSSGPARLWATPGPRPRLSEAVSGCAEVVSINRVLQL